MKKVIALMAMTSLAATAFGQGVIQFNNRDTTVTPNVNAAIYLDTVGVGTVGALSGSSYRAAILGGTTTSTAWSLAGGVVTGGTGLNLLGSANGTGATYATFRTGAASGFVAVGTDAARTVPGVDWGQAGLFQVVAWSGNYNTWADAIAAAMGGADIKVGVSNPLTLTLPSGATSPVLTTLQGLQSFAVVTLVPEPSTFALAGLGAAAMLIFRRRK